MELIFQTFQSKCCDVIFNVFLKAIDFSSSWVSNFLIYMWWTQSSDRPGDCPGERMFKSYLVCGCFRAIIDQTFSNLGSKTRKLARLQIFLITVTVPQLKCNIYKKPPRKIWEPKKWCWPFVSVPCLTGPVLIQFLWCGQRDPSWGLQGMIDFLKCILSGIDIC